MTEKSIPSRSRKPDAPPLPPGAPKQEEDATIVDIRTTAPEAPALNPFAKPSAAAVRRTDLAGRYRVREGYEVAYGKPQGGTEHTAGRHPQAKAGEVVDLTHEEAISIIRLTKDQRHPVSGRPNGPAIETELAYNSRITAEVEHKRFMEEVSGVDSLQALDA